MHGHQLPLKMSRKFGELQTVLRQSGEHLVAIGFTFPGALQIEQPAIPGRNLHSLIAQAGSPLRNTVQGIERSGVPRELSQKDSRPLDGFHGVRVSIKYSRLAAANSF